MPLNIVSDESEVQPRLLPKLRPPIHHAITCLLTLVLNNPQGRTEVCPFSLSQGKRKLKRKDGMSINMM